MKKLTIIIALALALTLASCTDSNEEEQAEAPVEQEEAQLITEESPMIPWEGDPIETPIIPPNFIETDDAEGEDASTENAPSDAPDTAAGAPTESSDTAKIPAEAEAPTVSSTTASVAPDTASKAPTESSDVSETPIEAPDAPSTNPSGDASTPSDTTEEAVSPILQIVPEENELPPIPLN